MESVIEQLLDNRTVCSEIHKAAIASRSIQCSFPANFTCLKYPGERPSDGSMFGGFNPIAMDLATKVKGHLDDSNWLRKFPAIDDYQITFPLLHIYQRH